MDSCDEKERRRYESLFEGGSDEAERFSKRYSYKSK
jgi:hypothetical protein